jgi:hypothetical protein
VDSVRQVRDGVPIWCSPTFQSDQRLCLRRCVIPYKSHGKLFVYFSFCVFMCFLCQCRRVVCFGRSNEPEKTLGGNIDHRPGTVGNLVGGNAECGAGHTVNWRCSEGGVGGVSCILISLISATLKRQMKLTVAHKHEVCVPGWMPADM